MSELRELRIIAKQMQDMGIEASCLFNAADRIEKLETALNKFLDDWDDGGPMCEPLRKALEGKDD